MKGEGNLLLRKGLALEEATRTLAASALEPSAGVLPFALEELDKLLPDGGLSQGQLTELASVERSGLSTWLSLRACRQAQSAAALHGTQSWCAFVDPTRTLFAPHVSAAGVELSRLLVLYPPLQSLKRVAVKLSTSRAFAVIVVDLQPAFAGARGGAPALGDWSKLVRRLALAIKGTQTVLLLLTDPGCHRAAPLPVGMRLELATILKANRRELSLTVTKDKRGRIGCAQTIDLACLGLAEPNPAEPKGSPRSCSDDAAIAAGAGRLSEAGDCGRRWAVV